MLSKDKLNELKDRLIRVAKEKMNGSSSGRISIASGGGKMVVITVPEHGDLELTFGTVHDGREVPLAIAVTLQEQGSGHVSIEQIAGLVEQHVKYVAFCMNARQLALEYVLDAAKAAGETS